MVRMDRSPLRQAMDDGVFQPVVVQDRRLEEGRQERIPGDERCSASSRIADQIGSTG